MSARSSKKPVRHLSVPGELNLNDAARLAIISQAVALGTAVPQVKELIGLLFGNESGSVLGNLKFSHQELRRWIDRDDLTAIGREDLQREFVRREGFIAGFEYGAAMCLQAAVEVLYGTEENVVKRAANGKKEKAADDYFLIATEVGKLTAGTSKDDAFIHARKALKDKLDKPLAKSKFDRAMRAFPHLKTWT